MSIEKQLENFQTNRALIEAQVEGFRRNPVSAGTAEQAETDTLSVVEDALQSSLRQLVSDLEVLRQVQPPNQDTSE